MAKLLNPKFETQSWWQCIHIYGNILNVDMFLELMQVGMSFDISFYQFSQVLKFVNFKSVSSQNQYPHLKF